MDSAILSTQYWIIKSRIWEFSFGPGGFSKIREAYWNHFSLSWYLSDSMVASYGPKTDVFREGLPIPGSLSMDLLDGAPPTPPKGLRFFTCS